MRWAMSGTKSASVERYTEYDAVPPQAGCAAAQSRSTRQVASPLSLAPTMPANSGGAVQAPLVCASTQADAVDVQ